MHAMTRDMVTLGGYVPRRSPFIELRTSVPRVPLAWQPALIRLGRLSMGSIVGIGLGATAGHTGFWLATGVALGAAMDAIIRRS